MRTPLRWPKGRFIRKVKALHVGTGKFLQLLAVAALLTTLVQFVGCGGVSSAGNNSNQTPPAGQLSSTSTSLGFGGVTLGSNKSLSETVTNSGTSSITISQVAISGSGFSVSGINAPMTVAPGQGATFSVQFSPSATGSASGSLTITSTASDSNLTIPLTGSGNATAAGQLTVTPNGTLPIGSVIVGSNGNAFGSLTASGASVTVTAAAINNSAFSLSGLSLPVTIPAGQSVPFTVLFSPSAAGSATATLTFTSNAQSSSTQETLTGTGAVATAYSVNLSWDASDSPDVSGYNIYRAVYTGSCGSFSKINSTLSTSTLYTDTVLIDGTSYCYATTSVNSNNEESGYSNIVTNVQIPTS
jgi:hypothetical protein